MNKALGGSNETKWKGVKGYTYKYIQIRVIPDKHAIDVRIIHLSTTELFTNERAKSLKCT